jgi:hypothetical protein
MVHIHVLLLMSLLELLVVFAALWVVWFVKLRALRRHMTGRSSVAAPPEIGHGAATYLSEEFIATRAYLDTGADDEDAAPSAALVLRAAYLEVEREFAEHGLRDAAFWDALEARLGVLPLPSATPASAPETTPALIDTEDASDDPQRFQRLIDAQVSTIGDLKEALAALLGEGEAGTDMLTQVDKLGRTNREMAMCVSILEDDNNFLRDKLKKAGVDIE